MTKETLAAMIDGREYLNEITGIEEALAAANGLIVVLGRSDDICEMLGAINDEVGADHGGSVFLSPVGRRVIEFPDRDELDVLRKFGLEGAWSDFIAGAIKIDVSRGGQVGSGWSYKTTQRHATFQVMEGPEVYCTGIVIDLKECAF